MEQRVVRFGRWRQISEELGRRATPSSWRKEVSHLRIREVDRIRPFVTRAVLTFCILGCLLALGQVHPWAWAVLAIPLLQSGLEVFLEEKTRDVSHRDRQSEVWLIRPLMSLWCRNKERIRVNATGLLGVLSCIAVGAIALFGTSGGPGWLRVLLLVLAVLFINSALLGPLLDDATFSANSSSGEVLRVMTYWWWLVILVVLVAFVLLADATGFWSQGTLPYAIGATFLTYAIGLRQRAYERDMDAGALAMLARTGAENREIRQFLHDVCQPVKAISERGRDGKTVELTPADIVALRVFMAMISETLRGAREEVDGRIELPGLDSALEVIATSAWFHPKVTRDTAAMGKLHEEDSPLADGLLMTLLFNSLQAYEPIMTAWRKTPPEERPPRPRPWIDMTVRVDMRDDDAEWVTLAVSDGLGLVSEHSWITSPTLTSRCRAVELRGGTMRQETRGVGKTVVAQWPVKPIREIDKVVH